MKSFRDSNQTEWTVFEVRRQLDKDEGAYLPAGYGEGWLCFETTSAKRRLLKYPPRWKELSDVELEQLLASAMPAPRPTERSREVLRGLGDIGGESQPRAD